MIDSLGYAGWTYNRHEAISSRTVCPCKERVGRIISCCLKLTKIFLSVKQPFDGTSNSMLKFDGGSKRYKVSKISQTLKYFCSGLALLYETSHECSKHMRSFILKCLFHGWACLTHAIYHYI